MRIDAGRPARGRPVAAGVWTGGNRILAHLPPAEVAVVRRSLSSRSVASGEVMYAQRGVMDVVYFPETAVMSLLNRMEDGAVVEVGTIGNESAVGITVFLGAHLSLLETIAQIPGTVQQMPATAFLSAMDTLPEFRHIVGACMHAFIAQVSQTAACNRMHGIEQRCARWLLMTHDRVGGADSFPLTHEFLSFMLGVRRAGVTEAIGALTLAALIRSGKGEITVLDRKGLEAACCECYSIVRRNSGAPFTDGVTAKSSAKLRLRGDVA